MKYLNMIGGGKMPALGFGTWQLRDSECVTATTRALEIGYRHIDTAQIYENEKEVGTAIAQSGVARDEIFLTTKLWTSNFMAGHVETSFEESLQKLQTNYVDLLLIHWHNPEVPLAETLGAMQKLLKAGKTRAIGVSNFPVALMQEAVEKIGAPIAANQVEYHPQLSQRPVLNYARGHNMIVTAYSPLGRGALLNHPTLEAIAARHGKSTAQVALRWLVEQDGVAAIPKAASEKNARANFEIFDFHLDREDTVAINLLADNKRLIDPEWAPEWDAA
jgi:2,5-diketo-D-gluconate reductase B